MSKQPHQVCRSTRAEPPVIELFFSKGIEQAERIIYIQHLRAEVITVILSLEHGLHFVLPHTELFRHLRNRLRKISLQLLLGYSAQSLIAGIHTDIVRLIETAEHTNLRKLRHPGKEYELQVIVSFLEHRIETFQNFPIPLFQFSFIFTYSDVESRPAEFLLPCPHSSLQNIFQSTGLSKIRSVEINMEYRIFIPILFQPFHGQSLEKLPPAEEIVFQRADQQALPEPPRTAKEIDIPFCN